MKVTFTELAGGKIYCNTLDEVVVTVEVGNLRSHDAKRIIDAVLKAMHQEFNDSPDHVTL
jgi:hypothetical protein